MNKTQIVARMLTSNAFHYEGNADGVEWFITAEESDAPHVLYGITAEKVLFSDEDDSEESDCKSQSFATFCKEAF